MISFNEVNKENNKVKTIKPEKVFTDWKNLKKKKISLVMFFMGIMPYLRYLILVNHSYMYAYLHLEIKL